MHVITFDAYDVGSSELPVQVQVFNIIRNGFRLKQQDPVTQLEVSVVRLGNDVDRLEAARELGGLLKAAQVTRAGQSCLNPDGVEWAMEDHTHALICEIYRTVRGMVFGLDDFELAADIDAFLTPSADGPTRKLTASEYGAATSAT